MNPTNPNRRRFDWLRDKRHRRSSLRHVHRAVRSRWPIDDVGRAALIAELQALLDAGDLDPREAIRIARIFLAMDAANASIARTSPPKPPRSPRGPGPDRNG